ncbi:E3 ubiquitin-protein ligase [Forsythia ovata]|uniref:E3 ubiquitin-protein ligase RMA n=1 Tax=Forsythia ovata TaxID=205694 RepID=A0ABD1QBP7_9LAMI
MAFDQHFLKKGKSIPTAGDDSEKTSAGFDCNICLDYARDPVVTLCGHLYCWPCIYKWLNFQRASLASDLLPQCPVCKAEVSEKTLIPLYGGGKSLSEIEQGDKIIPPRPPARGIQGLMYMSNLNQQLTPPNPYQNPNDLPNHYASYEEDSSSVLFNSAATGVSPMIGKFGEMVYARVTDPTHLGPGQSTGRAWPHGSARMERQAVLDTGVRAHDLLELCFRKIATSLF